MTQPKPDEDFYAIGEVSALSGLSPHTLRVWERRYGMPVAQRLPSGHRRYARNQVALLKAASELVALGHRPGKILALPPKDLHAMVERERAARRETYADDLDEVLAGPPSALPRMLDVFAQEHGIRKTVHEFIVPLIKRIGQAWAANEIDIHREHLLSESIQDVLRAARLQIMRRNADGEACDLILATLPGERHGLGLQMLSLLAVLGDARPLLLGVDLPIEEMVAASEEHPGATLVLSVSSASDVTTTAKNLRRLRELLPDEVAILAGGDGLPQRTPIPGLTTLSSLIAFEEWLQERGA